MSAALARFLAPAAAAALATALFARLAPRIGWTDAPRGADAARKAQRRPVPAVGGAALLVALALVPETLVGTSGDALWARWLPGTPWRLAALALVFVAGTLDDLRPLAPVQKSLALVLALAPLVLGAGLEHGPLAAPLVLVLAFAALNLLNTFDNADGALGGLCALGFAGAAAPVAGACLGFLPFNLDAARARNRTSAAPSAYLGDAGAFVLAYLALVNPRAAGVFVLPFLDLARLAWVRWRAGSRPWIGDRRHLAHRLQANGLGSVALAAVLCAIATPACALGWFALARDDARAAGLGVLATGALFALALRFARTSNPAAPCPPLARPE